MCAHLRYSSCLRKQVADIKRNLDEVTFAFTVMHDPDDGVVVRTSKHTLYTYMHVYLQHFTSVCIVKRVIVAVTHMCNKLAQLLVRTSTTDAIIIVCRPM
jgi:hypothetical protein